MIISTIIYIGLVLLIAALLLILTVAFISIATIELLGWIVIISIGWLILSIALGIVELIRYPFRLMLRLTKKGETDENPKK